MTTNLIIPSAASPQDHVRFKKLHFTAKIVKVKEEIIQKGRWLSVEWIQNTLFVFIIIMLFLSAYFSIRYRRQSNVKLRSLYAARMNICMGIMLIAIAITQLFFFHDSAIRRTFGTICILIGLFNLFAGLRNHQVAKRMN